jgi:hypothetical protein
MPSLPTRRHVSSRTGRPSRAANAVEARQNER